MTNNNNTSNRPKREMHPAKKIDKKTVKRLFSYILRYKIRFSLVIIFIIISSVITAFSTKLLGETLIDKYILPYLKASSIDYPAFFKFLGFLATIYLVGVTSSFFYTRIMVDISQGVLKTIRDELFTHMQKLPIRYFDTNSRGNVMSRFTNDTDTLRQLITQSIPQFFSTIITLISVSITMITLNIWLTVVVVLLTIFLTLSVLKKITAKSSKHFVKQQQTLGDLNGYIEEMIQGQKVVKVFCYEKGTTEVFEEKNATLRQSAYRANTFASMLMPIVNNLGILQCVILAIIGGYLAIKGIGGVTIGVIASFIMLSRNFNMPIAQISQQLNVIIMAFAGSKRIFELLDEKTEDDNGYVSLVNAKEENGKLVETKERTGVWAWKHPHSDGKITYTKLLGEISLIDVDFSYDNQKTILHNINIDAKSGQKIALVGATGAGKTTITNLLNKFYDISSGKIRYDGINIDKIKKKDLRNALGVVLQETNLFTGTIIDNIRYGRLDATDEECIEAGKKANAHYFIELLKDGYNTVITGNGEGLSQGQRQLLSIARAIVADPPVMILDEATSSIDTHTEAIVQKGMDMLMKGRTVFVIAHRLSTIQNSDKIIVLDFGKIIEQGSHEELIEQKGKYYQLYTGLFELE